jgi:hypothetical protein
MSMLKRIGFWLPAAALVLWALASPWVNAQTQPTPGGVRLIRSDAAGVELEVTAPQYQVTRDARLQAAGFDVKQQPGRPDLPFKSVLLGAPPEARVSVQILQDQAATLTGVYRLAVTRHATPAAFDPDDGTALAGEIPLPPGAYPAELVQVVDDNRLRDQRVVRLEIYPFRYDDQTGRIEQHTQMRVLVKFEGGRAAEQSGAALEHDSIEATLQGALLNYDTALAWRSEPPQPGAAVNAQYGADCPTSYKIVV